MKHLVRMGALAALTTVALSSLTAQEMVKEPSTGKSFPSQITLTHDGTSHTLKLTGTAVRKKFVFKVYGMAHYAEDPQPGSFKNVIAGILKDGKAKQITMEFVRDVEVDKILSAYRDGFAENATPEEQKAVKPSLEKFLTYFTKDVKENDRFVLQWLPGGVVLAETQGEPHPAITDATFARVLWTIWLGEDSIVDPEDLVALIVR